MASYAYNYIFNIAGNVKNALKDIRTSVEGVTFACNQAKQYVENLNQSFKSVFEPGAALNASLAELQAVSGAAGEELAAVEKAARSTAREFGGSAASAVESYKLLLSQLSPELTKNGEALNAMGRNVAILSKTMGGDVKSAAEVLTTAMNQYGVSLEDPMEASHKMAEMMNIMAAAGREGSAELPTIKVALEQCGMMAKSAGVSFAETNAAIQVLDKAGKKGSEGGVALRNVMSTLAQGRFLPKDVTEELTAAGVNINALTDKSESLSERLKLLQPVLKDDALFSKLFGKENSAAAMALVQGIPQVEKWTEAISGTNTAVEQSQIIMETYNEKLARVQAQFDDFKISIFNSIGDFGIWAEVITSALVPISQLTPLVSGVISAVAYLGAVSAKAIKGIGVWSLDAIAKISALNKRIIASGGYFAFMKKMANDALSAIRRKTISAIIGLQMLNIATFGAGGAFGALKIAAVSACRSIGVAIMNIPIIGWIAAGITAVIALIKLLWDKCKGFRVVVFTAWEAIKAVFGLLKELFAELWQKIVGALSEAWVKFKTTAAKIGGLFMDVFRTIGSIYSRIWGIIKGIVSSLIDKTKEIFNAVKSAVSGAFTSISEWFGSMYEIIWTWISGIASRIAEFASGIWNAIKSVGERIAGVFAGIISKIRSWVRSITSYLSAIFGAIADKVATFFAPLTSALKNLAKGIRETFGGAINWIRDKFLGLINWFIDKYNYIAKKLNWEEIKRLGREDAERSWAKDHPNVRKTESPTATESQTENATEDTNADKPKPEGGNDSPLGNALGGIGGGASKETDKVKNIYVTIERLIDTFTISTTNMAESRERIKDMVAEALVSAVNDVNYA